MDAFTLRTHDTLDELKAPWEAILAGNASPSLFLDFGLVRAWYEHFLGSAAPCLFSVWDGDACVCIFPAALTTKYGSTVINSLYVGGVTFCPLLVRDDCRDDVVRILLDLLVRSGRTWHAIKFSEVYSFSPLHAAFERMIGENCPLDFSTFSEPTYCVDLDGDFQAYLNATLSAHIKKNYKWRRNKIAKTPDSGTIFLRDAQVLEHFDAFCDIENTGWKQSRQSSLRSGGPLYAYFQELLAVASRQGRLYGAFLRLNGRLVAGNIGFIEDGALNIVRTAFLEEFRTLSPSNLLFIETVRYFTENDRSVRRVNYFPKSYGYKHSLTHDRETCDTYIFANATLVSRAYLLLYKLKMRSRKNEDDLKHTRARDAD